MLAKVKQATIGPLIPRTIAPGAVVHTARTTEGFWSLLRGAPAGAGGRNGANAGSRIDSVVTGAPASLPTELCLVP